MNMILMNDYKTKLFTRIISSYNLNIKITKIHLIIFNSNISVDIILRD
jgi:hypothetical protein